MKKTDQNKIIAEQIKEIEALRVEIKEKDSQIKQKDTKIEIYESALSEFEEKTEQTGEKAKDYLIIFSGLILSLVGNLLSWTRFIINRKKVKLEENILLLDLEIKKKELENLGSTIKAKPIV